MRERIRLFLATIGFALAVVLFAAILKTFVQRTEEPAQSEASTEETREILQYEVERRSNVWVTGADEESVTVFWNGEISKLPVGFLDDVRFVPDETQLPCLADITLTDGGVTRIEQVPGGARVSVLGVDNAFVMAQWEDGSRKRLSVGGQCGMYDLRGEIHTLNGSEIPFGACCVELYERDGAVCGLVIREEPEEREDIRILLKTNDFAELFHAGEELALSSGGGLLVREYLKGEGEGDRKPMEYSLGAGEVYRPKDSAFQEDVIAISVEPLHSGSGIRMLHLERAQGVPEYGGRLEIFPAGESYAVVNVLPLEEYLLSVVPSEMPSSYPEQALYAQAVCARTYAYRRMLHAAYAKYGAHLDDSTSYQVYNNIIQTESTDHAVHATEGQILVADRGEVAETFYYSTSCGVGSDANVWKTEAAKEIDYIKSTAIRADCGAEERLRIGESLREEKAFADFIRKTNPKDYEAKEKWYRWSYAVKQTDTGRMYETMKRLYGVNPALVLTKDKTDGEYISDTPKKFSVVKEIRVVLRGAGGVADELYMNTDSGEYKILSEYNIRSVLCDGKTKVAFPDGTSAEMPNLVPSAYFVLKTQTQKGKVTGYTLTGGGFGHGVGMSQNGAKNMAKAGMEYKEILEYFFEELMLVTKKQDFLH